MGFIIAPLIGIILNGGILFALTKIVEGVNYTGGFKFFVLGGIILGLFNFFIRPVIKIISLPFILLTGGIVLIAVNMVVLRLLSYFFDVLSFQNVTLVFENFTTYVIGAIVFGAINWAAHLFVK